MRKETVWNVFISLGAALYWAQIVAPRNDAWVMWLTFPVFFGTLAFLGLIDSVLHGGARNG